METGTVKSRYFTVDFVGWFGPDTLNENDIKDGVTGKGIDVKFVINPDGSYYVLMVSKIEAKSDGKVYGSELQDSTGVLTNIYANKKISLLKNCRAHANRLWREMFAAVS